MRSLENQSRASATPVHIRIGQTIGSAVGVMDALFVIGTQRLRNIGSQIEETIFANSISPFAATSKVLYGINSVRSTDEARILLEQKRISNRLPATKISPEEISQVQRLQEMIDGFLGGKNSRDLKFDDTLDYRHKNPRPGGKGSLLASKDWPDPLKCRGVKINVTVSRSAEKDGYTIEIVNDRNYGVHFTLQNSYSRVDKIVQAEDRESNRSDLEPWKPVRVPYTDNRLRPRTKRLEFGMFLIRRIQEANEGVALS